MLLPTRRTDFRRRALIIAVVTITVAGIMVLFGLQSVQRIQAVEKHWAVYSLNAGEAGRLLHSISRQMGYGGFIHNFKNYILRRDVIYLPMLLSTQDTVYADLTAMERHMISGEEKAALSDIRSVFDHYAQAIPVARSSFEHGLTSIEVDILVKIDDEPALKALDDLNHSFLTRTRLAERETNKAMRAASSMIWVLLGVVPVIVLLGVVLISFLRRIMIANGKLAEVRDELATLLRQAPDAILHVGSDGHILRANDRSLTLFCYPLKELLDKNIEDLIPGRFQDDNASIRNRIFEGKASRSNGNGTELNAITKDGVNVPVDISLNFSLSGGKRTAIAIVRDVTERKRAADALKKAHDELELRVEERTNELVQRTAQLELEIVERQRAENQLVQSAKMATIGEMASGITHELNQPMNIMRMGVESAQIRIERGQADMDLMAETLARVENQIVRMADIINHMRVYSRQDSDGQVLFNPYQAVNDGCQLFSGQLSSVDVSLKLRLPDGHVGMVLGHTTRLEQVMLNLLSNARDSVLARHDQAKGGFVGCITVEMGTGEREETLLISVEDNGGGIPDEVLPHIFAPFVTTKASGQGTGLGLSISYGIIETMGGAIAAMNTDQGARFEISLPLVDEEPQNAETTDNSPAAASGPGMRAAIATAAADMIKVMVVDDEITAAHSLSDFLQEIGYVVSTAYNGEEAIQLFESDPCDAVITDLRMPVMDGEELIRRLRAASSSMPIFAMTGHGPVGEEEDNVALGATEVWRKPLSLGEVAQRLHSICGPGVPRHES